MLFPPRPQQISGELLTHQDELRPGLGLFETWEGEVLKLENFESIGSSFWRMGACRRMGYCTDTIQTAMVAPLIFQTLDLPLLLQCDSTSSIPQLDLQQIAHQSMETARHHICIYHVILIGLGQSLNLHLPLQCNSEFATREDTKAVYRNFLGVLGVIIPIAAILSATL